MIKLLWIFLFSTNVCANLHQDIVFKSRFDLESSGAFIQQLREFLINNKFGDPYSQNVKKPISIDLAQLLSEIPNDTQKWIRELQSVLKVQVFESNYRLNIENFSYSIKDFNSEFLPGKSNRLRAEYVTVNFINGLHITADKIVFEVELKQTQTRNPIKFKVELIGPEFLVHQDLTAELPMGWSTAVMPENIFLTLESVDISKVMEKIVKKPNLIDLRIKDMVMPNVSIKVGSKEIKFDQEKIKRFFVNRKEEMKKGILDLLNVRMKERFSNILSDSPKKLQLPRTYGLQSEINGVFDVQTMDVNRTGIVHFDIDGHFCDIAPMLENDFCQGSKIPARVRRNLPDLNYGRSLRELNRTLIEKKTNIAVSVSENYLNQLVEATIRAGLWEASFQDKPFKLGPEKSFLLADEKGETLSLYMDIIYKLSKTERILVGRSELRFPIKFKIAVKIEEIDRMPHLTIKVKEIGTDEKLLLEGAPELGLPTNVNNVPRFRKKVLKAIMEDVSSFDKQILIDVVMKELEGTYLDQLEFVSDGLGRANALIGFKKLDNK